MYIYIYFYMSYCNASSADDGAGGISQDIYTLLSTLIVFVLF